MLTPELTKSIVGYIQERIIAQTPTGIAKLGMSFVMGIIRERPNKVADFIKDREPNLLYMLEAMNLARDENGVLDYNLVQKIAREAINSTGPITIFGYTIGSAEVDDIIDYFKRR